MKPTISVVIPSYNQQDFLSDAIESAINQTVKPLEIIVVDDGSTDSSLKIARKYPVKVISQVNKGLSSARNTGIMNATGDYILFLDADDILKENCIERISEVILATQSDIVSLSFKTFGIVNSEVILMPKPTLEDFKSANRVGYCSAIKRSVLLEIGGYNPKMLWGWEDWDLWIDLLKREKTITTIPEVLWLYRTKERSMIHVANEHGEELSTQMKKNHPEIYA